MLATLIILTCTSAACSPKNQLPTERKPAEQNTSSASVYFPAEPGMVWIYEGKGNEYAGFRRTAVLRENTQAQFNENNGGTQTGLVYQITPEAVILLYAAEEYYTNDSLLGRQPNRSETLLKTPLTPGAGWQDDRRRREVVSTDDTLTVPAGTYTKVLKIKSTPLKDHSSYSVTEYYAPGVGLVAREYAAQDFTISSHLKAFSRR